jgi:adenine-specific DNA methylase
LLAVVTLKEGQQGRQYRLANDRDFESVWMAHKKVKKILDDWEKGGKKGLCPVPDEPTPAGGGSGAGRAFSVQKYGMMKFGDLFTARQKVGLVTLVHHICQLSGPAIVRQYGIVIGRLTDATSSLCSWLASGEEIKHVFSRQALPIVWDFGETNLLSPASRSWDSAIDAVGNVIESMGSSFIVPGQSQQADALHTPHSDGSVELVFTDPPYYDAIPYSDLSDFFLVWLKRVANNCIAINDPFNPENILSPKDKEAVQDESKSVCGSKKDRIFFENVMAKSFAESRRILKEDGITSVVFAHKTTEGWESLLSGMIRGGYTITSS